MKIPNDIQELFDEETRGVQFGSVTLTVQFNLKTGKPRWIIGREKSHFSEDDDEDQKDKKSGRSHVNEEQVSKAKAFMRLKRPEGVRAIDIAKYVGCTQSRAVRIMDLLSNGTDFLVHMEDDKRPTLYFIFKDVETERVT